MSGLQKVGCIYFDECIPQRNSKRSSLNPSFYVLRSTSKLVYPFVGPSVHPLERPPAGMSTRRSVHQYIRSAFSYRVILEHLSTSIRPSLVTHKGFNTRHFNWVTLKRLQNVFSEFSGPPRVKGPIF